MPYKEKPVHLDLCLTAQSGEKNANANVSLEMLNDESKIQLCNFSKAPPKQLANNSQAKISGEQSNSSYIWPTVSIRITQYFNSKHKGIDIGGVNPGVDGDDLYAFCNGKVIRVFNWTHANGKLGDNSMGNAVFIHSLNPKPSTGGKYLRTLYMHLKDPTHLKVGDTVKKGDIVGKMGNTGYSFGTHLHFGMQVDNSNFNPSGGSAYYINNYFVNPLLYFK